MFSSVVSYLRSPALRASLTNFRTFHYTPVAAKNVTEKVSDVADKAQVNKKVGKGLASAIEKGEQVTQSTKETLDAVTGEVKDKAQYASQVTAEQTKNASNIAGQKLNQAATGARETKDNVQKEMSE